MNRIGIPAMLGALALLGGCVSNAPTQQEQEPQKRTAVLKEGTEIKLILLKQLESGGTPVGEQAPLLVVEDVKDAEGAVLIPKGAIAYGEVTRSRRATTATAVINQPARLAISVDKTFAADGKEVPLKVEEDDPEAPAQLTRGSTGPDIKRRLDEVWGEESEEILKGLQEMFQTGQAPQIATDAALADLAGRLSMPNTVALAGQGGVGRVAALLKGIEAGSLKAISGGEAMLMIGAVTELANLAGHVANRIGGMLKGANIRAYPGTPLTAFVQEDVRVEVPIGSR